MCFLGEHPTIRDSARPWQQARRPTGMVLTLSELITKAVGQCNARVYPAHARHTSVHRKNQHRSCLTTGIMAVRTNRNGKTLSRKWIKRAYNAYSEWEETPNSSSMRKPVRRVVHPDESRQSRSVRPVKLRRGQ